MIDYIYFAGAYLRRKLYEKNILKVKKLPLPVISVGNLSTGGTGKTPLTIYFAKYFQKKNMNPVVLSRGYKRKSKGTLIISDGKNIFTSLEESGDEPYLIAKKNIPVVVSNSRYKGGLKAIKDLNPDIFILDDGFQHFQLYRDINILVVDLTKPFWEDKLLPFGRLREPESFYKYADFFIITKWKNNEKKLDKLKEFKIPYFLARENADRLTDFKDEYPLSILENKEVIVFSGIGNNRYFFKVMKEHSKKYRFKIKKFISFPDHYDYKDFKPLEDADFYITTEKDLIKVKNPKTVALKYEINFDENFTKFLDLKLNEIITKYR
jgi:tetraacyldisaccharide 4'-kinase